MGVRPLAGREKVPTTTAFNPQQVFARGEGRAEQPRFSPALSDITRQRDSPLVLVTCLFSSQEGIRAFIRLCPGPWASKVFGALHPSHPPLVQSFTPSYASCCLGPGYNFFYVQLFNWPLLLHKFFVFLLSLVCDLFLLVFFITTLWFEQCAQQG